MPTTPKISLLPESLDLALYAGDGASIQLLVTDNDSAPLAVEGEVTAQIRSDKLAAEVLAEFNADLTNGSTGIVLISLSGEQTAALITTKPVFKGVWDVQWLKPDSQPITLAQGKVECNADVTR
jgi:hypothetical protein